MIQPGTIFAYSLGDTNLDGAVTIVDALFITQYVAGLDLNMYNAFVMDVDFNNKIDMLDALLVARFSAGLIENF